MAETEYETDYAYFKYIINGELYIKYVDHKRVLEIENEKAKNISNALTRRNNSDWKFMNDNINYLMLESFKEKNKYKKTINDLRTLIPKDKLDEFDAKSD